jgi:hypothetical protein
MKLFINKWRGYWLSSYHRKVAVLSCIIIVVVIFLSGILSWIPWSYAAGFVTLVGVIAAIIKFYPSNMGYERKTAESTTQKREMTKVEELHDSAESVPRAQEEQKLKSVLLPDGADFASLSIDNDFLNQLYGQAYRHAITKYHDAKLGSFVLDVYPFMTAFPRVQISLYFRSLSTKRQCRFDFDDKDNQIRNILPDGFIKNEHQMNSFSTLPWDRSPHWLQFLKQMYGGISPLSQVTGTHCSLHVFPHEEDNATWLLSFKDGFQGRVFDYEWNGKEINDDNIKSS